jgi:transcription elongation GreA/GreB family factor
LVDGPSILSISNWISVGDVVEIAGSETMHGNRDCEPALSRAERPRNTMSRAFVKESDQETIDLPDRQVSPHPNFVTAQGFAAIERALDRYDAAHTAAVNKGDKLAISAAQRELRYWTARRASAQVIEPLADKTKVHFGATVTVRRDDGRMQTFHIVGEDEAEPSRGTLSHVSPLACALFGKSVGDVVEIADAEAEILEIK